MKRFKQTQEVIDRFDLDVEMVPEPPSLTT
jgi:hypothetical protein